MALALPWATASSQVGAKRIVSLVPAVTEMLFAIGAGPQVVGVSSFDNYPPEARTRTRVGALVDPDLERILSLRPDLVVTYGSQDDLQAQLERAGIATFSFRHGGLADVAATMRALGSVTGHVQGGERAAAEFQAAIERVRTSVRGRVAPRTLLVFGREPGSLRNTYASGGKGFLHEALVAAGGRNVFEDVDRESLPVSSELILARAPDVILELRAWGLDQAVAARDDLTPWRRLAAVPAVRMGRVHVLKGDHFVVAGPRLPRAIEEIARVLHGK